MTGPVLVGQFWGLDSDRILKLVLREIILSQEIQMPPGGRRAVGPRLQQFLPGSKKISVGLSVLSLLFRGHDTNGFTLSVSFMQGFDASIFYRSGMLAAMRRTRRTARFYWP